MSRSPRWPARVSASAAVDALAPGPGRHQVRLIFSAALCGAEPLRPARPDPIAGRAPGEYVRAVSAGGVPAGRLRRRRDNPAAW